MKKEFLKFAGLFVFTLAVLASCSKDEDKVNAPDTLVGTSWLYETTTTEDGVEVGVGIEIDFTSATRGQINILIGGISDEAAVIAGFQAGEFTYTYSKPTVKITVDDETDTGKIDGNKLTFGDTVFEKE